MSHNWNYVIVGYVLVFAAIVVYFTSVRVRARRLRRALNDDDRS